MRTLVLDIGLAAAVTLLAVLFVLMISGCTVTEHADGSRTKEPDRETIRLLSDLIVEVRKDK